MECPKCKSKNVREIFGSVIDIFPAFYPFLCLNCNHKFNAQKEEYCTIARSRVEFEKSREKQMEFEL